MPIVCSIYKYTSDGTADTTARSSILKLLCHYKLDAFAMLILEFCLGSETEISSSKVQPLQLAGLSISPD